MKEASDETRIWDLFHGSLAPVPQCSDRIVTTDPPGEIKSISKSPI
jgi:hypothetical protein